MEANISNATQNGAAPTSSSLLILDPAKPHTFVKPIKKIHEGQDVSAFLTSQAYRDIGIFVMQLNLAMCPRKTAEDGQFQTWQIDSPITLPEPVQKLQQLLQCIDSIIEEAPPDTGPRRFGNVSFRKWYEILESRVRNLLETHLPRPVLDFSITSENGVSVLDELTPYLMGGFGSSQRLDYGTGHELSFLAFLGCIWKLGGFPRHNLPDGVLERSIVIGVFEPYLRVVRRLILTYTLEPAGSHGVWGLDDHSALPYILGSAQLCPAINDNDPMPVEGALPGAPNPGDIAKKNIVDKERKHNMYFSAVGFINDVKTGPFWEHSPMLFDISGVRTGWGKINKACSDGRLWSYPANFLKGMIKMYNGEVLSKFPVVQHFPFGSLFSWTQDPSAAPVPKSIHTASQPPGRSAPSYVPRPLAETKKALWAQGPSNRLFGESTAAPWAKATPIQSLALTKASWASDNSAPRTTLETPTRPPWTDKKESEGR